MHTHHHHDHHSHHDADSGLADQLDLDARLTGPYLGELTGWLWGLAPAQPRRVADLGAGTGAHTLELARRFPQAEIVAVDNSAVMLDRIRAAAREQGVADRLRLVQADLDAGWPPVGAVDVVWAASSLHHVADPDRLLRDAHAALNPGGLLAVIEMDGLPRFLPDDPHLARPGLEERCRAAAAQAGWNAYPADPDQPAPRVNPLLNFDHGLDVAASILISVMSTPDMVAEMGVTSEGPTSYAVTNGTNNLESLATGPLVFVEGEGRTPEEATRIARKAIDQVKEELDVRQRQVQAPEGTYITISEAVPPTTPGPQQGRKLRSAAAALGMGVIASLCASFAAESLSEPLRARLAGPLGRAGRR
ncbi:class I SAM-dependent methyltransferase, partial [Nonomuraea sp. NPDC004297]